MDHIDEQYTEYRKGFHNDAMCAKHTYRELRKLKADQARIAATLEQARMVMLATGTPHGLAAAEELKNLINKNRLPTPKIEIS